MHFDSVHIGYSTKKPLLKIHNVSLKKEKLTVLIGANASGKSTLIRSMAGLHKPLSGTIFLEDKPLNSCSSVEIATHLSLVFSKPEVPFLMRVNELLQTARIPYLHGLKKLKTEDYNSIEKALKLLDLWDLRENLLSSLSDGQRQKAFIARALAQETPLLFLDEPEAHLDPQNRFQLLYALHSILVKEKKTILLSSHSYDTIFTFADEVWLITSAGELLIDSPENLFLSGKINKMFPNSDFSFDKQAQLQNNLFGNSYREINISGSPNLIYWFKCRSLKYGIQWKITTYTKNHISLMYTETEGMLIVENGKNLKFESYIQKYTVIL